MSSRKKEENVDDEINAAKRILAKYESNDEYGEWKNLPGSGYAWTRAEVLASPVLIKTREDSLRRESSDKKRNLGDTESLSSGNVLKKKADSSGNVLKKKADSSGNVLKKKADADTQMNINSLPVDVLTKIFSYLSHNELGCIARVCKTWLELTRSPSLWKEIDVQFTKSESQNEAAAGFLKNLPSCVTLLGLDFQNRYGEQCLKFDEFCAMLGERCPSLKVLLLRDIFFSVSQQSAIDLCRRYLPNLEVLSISFCNFSDHSIEVEYGDFSKIELLDLRVNFGTGFSKITFSKMSSLKKLMCYRSGESDFWFEGDTSFLQNLEVLNLNSSIHIGSGTFRSLQNHALKLTELYLCQTNLKDGDFRFRNSMFPHLKTLCLRYCSLVTCEMVVSFVRSCQSLQDVYVGEEAAESYAEHSYVVANRSKLEIVKTAEICHSHLKLPLHEISIF